MPSTSGPKANLSLLIILIAGLAQGLSFAPGPLPGWTLPFVQIASLAFVANYTWLASNKRQAAFYGWLFGFAQFSIGVYWLTISMHTYGGLAMPLAIGALFIFAAAMAIYGALACAISYYLCSNYSATSHKWRRQLLNAIIWASAWTIFEWLRGTLFTGFTWLVSGYAHAEGMFTAWAPIFGVYGISWLAAFSAAAIALMVHAKDTAHDKHAALVIGLALIFGLLGMAFKHIAWSTPTGDTLLVRLVQTNTSQHNKFEAEQFWLNQSFAVELAATPIKPSSTEQSTESTSTALPMSPDLIVLPETVVPILSTQAPSELWQQWQDLANQTGAQIILGVPLDLDNKITNSVIAIDPNNLSNNLSDNWHYDKQHLVPFGEFIPYGFRWFVDALQIPLGDFDNGATKQLPLNYKNQNIAFNICYEDTFGNEIAASVSPEQSYPGANILINVSNLAWFGDSWALRQQLWMARIRSIETARPMLRSTNTGISAVIDPNGIVRGMLDPNIPGILDAEIIGAKGLTPYVKYGDLPILLISIIGLFAGWLKRKQ